MSGVTPAGLEILSLQEVLAQIEAGEQVLIDPNISLGSDTLTGQLNIILSTAIADQWALQQSVYDAGSPLLAEGTALDNIASITGQQRAGAIKTRSLWHTFTGPSGTVVAANTQVRNPLTGDIYKTLDAFGLTETLCYGAVFSVFLAVDNTDYSVIINGKVYTITSGTGATEQEIVTALKVAIDADNTQDLTAALELATNDLVVTTNAERISCAAGAQMELSAVIGTATVEALVTGPLIAGAGNVTELVTSNSALTATVNARDYITGQNVETDKEFRARILISQSISGAGTLPAIKSNIAALAGVTAALVVENNTTLTDAQGRPPKSIELVVSGGDDAEIAQTLIEIKGAGIESHGNTEVEALNTAGGTEVISFTRPAAVIIAVRLTYVPYEEEAFPTSGPLDMQLATVGYIESLLPDNDVLPLRLSAAVADAVAAGLSSLTVELQVLSASGDTPIGGSWSTTATSIDYDEIAKCNAVDVYVVGP